MNKVAVVGDCSTDHFLVMGGRDVGVIHPDSKDEKICFNAGEKIPVERVVKSFGGSALNVSIGLAALGIDTQLTSFIGNDFEGREIISHLDAARVGHDHVVIDKQTNQSFIVLFDHDRTVLSNHLERNYSRLKIPRANYIYLSSAGQGCEDMVNSIRASIGRGAKLIINPGSYILRDFDFFKPLLSQTMMLVLNSDEADELFPANKVIDQLAKILASGIKLAIITSGKNGAYFGAEGKYYHMSAPASKVVDPTGAGDAFSAGLLAGLLHSKTLEESARWGMISSSAVIEEIGATTNVITIDEIDKHLEKNKILKFSEI